MPLYHWNAVLYTLPYHHKETLHGCITYTPAKEALDDYARSLTLSVRAMMDMH